MTKNKPLRCIHRHKWPDHKSCFAKGLIKGDWTEKEFIKETGLPWYRVPGYKICYLDIETDNLNADWGTVLSWVIKEKDGEVYLDYITKEELFNGTLDKRIVESFVNKLKDYSIAIGYYSDRFDLAFMRAKALHYGIDFPYYNDIYAWDLFYTVRSKLKISRRSLDNVCNYIGIKGKTPIEKSVWRSAKYGDPKAIQIVVEHNIADVLITEKLHDKLEFSRKWIKKSI